MTGDHIRKSLGRQGMSDAEVWDIFFAMMLHGMATSGGFRSEFDEATNRAADIADAMMKCRNKRRPKNG